MKKKVAMRKYKFSDAFLKQYAEHLLSSIRRDKFEFEDRGFNPTKEADFEKLIPSLPKNKQNYMKNAIKKLKKIADSGDKSELGKQATQMGLQMNLTRRDMPNQVDESHCGCSKKSKETADEEEFEMQLKNKKKLTESIIKKFRFGSK